MIEDLEIWQEYKENFNLDARDFLIEKYLEYSFKIVLKIYRKYKDIVNIDQEELYGISSFILLRAIEKFDYKKGVSFIKFFNTFSKWLLKNELSKYMNLSLRNQNRIIKNIEELTKNNKDNNKKDSYNKLVKLLLKLSFRNINYLDEKIKDNNLTYIETIQSNENIEYNIELKEITQHVINFINYDLTDSERKIIEMKYFRDMELIQISKELNISLQRCSQIHKKALEKIKEYLLNKIT
ncbi:MAG: sigma-70 family RNA polymerase sigma factor [bacterium]|nr:sigma-70 family RNA polymerase sigma factor [bacterium]